MPIFILRMVEDERMNMITVWYIASLGLMQNAIVSICTVCISVCVFGSGHICPQKVVHFPLITDCLHVKPMNYHRSKVKLDRTQYRCFTVHSRKGHLIENYYHCHGIVKLPTIFRLPSRSRLINSTNNNNTMYCFVAGTEFDRVR